MKKEFKERTHKVIHRFLRIMQRKKPFFINEIFPMADGARQLKNYVRVHKKLIDILKGNLKGKKITHLAAGNGQYMHFLRTKYGAKTTAIEPNKKIIKTSKSKGIKPNFKKRYADKTKLKSNSQDVVISDHFMFSGYDYIRDYPELKEANRILRRGGILILERAYAPGKTIMLENGFELISKDKTNIIDSITTNECSAFRKIN